MREEESSGNRHVNQDGTNHSERWPIRRTPLIGLALAAVLVWVAVAAIIGVAFSHTTYGAEYTAALVLMASVAALWICVAKVKMRWPMPALVVPLALVFVAVLIIGTNQTENRQTGLNSETAPVESSAPTAGGTAATSPVQQPSEPSSEPPKVYPPLRISSSGRIPTSLQGFALGMSFPDAVRLNPGLRNELGSKEARPSLNASNEALLHETNAGGISVTVEFAAGRIIDIIAEVNSIDSGDAEQIQVATFRELGTPSREIDQRDLSYPSRRWVWVDGDARIAYQDKTQSDGSHDVDAELIDYPFYVHALEQPGIFDSRREQQYIVQQTKREWGAEPNPNPYVSVPLPDSIEGLKLGETPAQVSAALPNANMSGSPDETYGGSYRFSNGNQIRFNFVGNKLAGICEDRLDIPPGKFDEFRKNLSVKFGTPNVHNLLGGTGWNNGKVIFYYLINKSEQGGNPFMVVCVDDRLLERQEDPKSEGKLKAAFPSQYKAAPADHSLFLTQDLRPQQ